MHAFARPAADGGPALAADPVQFQRINKVFMLDEHFLPGASILKWEGPVTFGVGGAPFEIKVP